VCTRAMIIARGRVVADGTPADLEARSPRHNAITLRLGPGPDAETARCALAALPDAHRVEVQLGDDGRLAADIVPAEGRLLAVAVGELVRQRGWEVEELQVRRGRLDEVFRTVTADAATG